jgi:SAM-dependent methyltransferase
MPEPTKTPSTTSADWQARYNERNTPWDSGLVDRELRDYLARRELGQKPCRALEFGCGTGINAVHMAEAGLAVTAVDFAPNAVEAARRRAEAAGQTVERAITFVVGDVTNLTDVAGPFDFVFDRGCYHSVRRAGFLGGFLKTLDRLTTAGSRVLILAGNPDAGEPGGPPKVTAVELCGDFERNFRIEHLSAMRFEDAGNVDGPLGWRLEMVRR